MEDLALDRAALEDVTLGGVELVEPGGQQSMDRRRYGDVRLVLLGEHRHHLFDEERVARRGVEDPVA